MKEIKAILEISKTPSTNAKIALLREYDCPELRELLVSAFDTFKVYGIKKLNYKEAPETLVYLPNKHKELLNILEMLTKTNTNDEIRQVVIDFLDSTPNPQQKIYYDIIVKDLLIGATAKTINKAFGCNLIPNFELMSSESYSEENLDTERIVQPKFDGYRCLGVKQGNIINFYSRNGNVIPLQNISKELLKIKGDFVLDGELVATTRTKTSGICNSLIKGNKVITDEDLCFHIFDFLDYNEYKSEKFSTPQKERLLNLSLFLLNNKVNPKFIKESPSALTYSTKEVMELYREARDRGEEGIMVKDPQGLYETKRSSNWLKVKAINSCTLQVIGKFEHKHGNTLGGFECITSDGVPVNVGNGFTDEDRKFFWEAKTNGIFIEVLFNEIQYDKEGKPFIFLPRFKEVRTDKEEADSIEKILKEQR